ncbi:MerR family transcriptional regulator [Neptunomonas antarctica]|uniref:DNA-binding transcriptional regulator, MerR family n=1 Tax=Neptunomonas antarctica TaxID=619304 RepID=A0A1N7P1X9_9GAMM|nr:MerR family DNA-binding transcriptional regulator [Neptunomonas antarctica]SIT04581.1 DNA-binding transcriptional regulator, MerR family [Neptunomonas antarctica]
METKTSYSISELSTEFDITTRSIRFYEDQGLLSPSRRGQTRIYSRQDRVRLKLILRGKRLGFSLAETGELFALWDETLSGSEKQLNLLLNKITERKKALEQQLNDIAMVRLELENAETRCTEALQELSNKKIQKANPF